MLLTKRIARVMRRFATIPQRLQRIQEALGRIEQRQVAQQGGDAQRAEYRVFSQWGEDGIIQFLIGRIHIENRIFVEFGVENYTESNTRFLLSNDHWSGLVIDASAANIDYIKRDPIYWACDLKALQAFVTRDNINDILRENAIHDDIGLLSVDIDGNDYWVWQAIDAISPRIVVCEYNSHFGPTAQVTVPYDPKFVRERAHFSRIYYGASISALCSLGKSKGYSLVAANSAGNNVFFVREDLRGELPVLSAADAYRRAQFREFHDESGHLTFDGFATRLRKIGHLPLLDLASNQVRQVAQIVENCDRAGGT
jgi:hypothetical protein